MMVVPKLLPILFLALAFIVAPEPARDSPTKLGDPMGPSKIPALQIH